MKTLDLINSQMFTRAIRMALFWDEDGDWSGATALGLLRVMPGEESTGAMERTPLGESVAALVVDRAVRDLAHDENGDALRAILLLMPCKYADAVLAGGHDLLEALANRDLLYREEGRSLAKHGAMIHTWLGHEVVTSMRGGKDPHGVPKCLALCESEKRERIRNVRDCGAKGNGTDDDSPAIQAAIDAAAAQSQGYDEYDPCGARLGSWCCQLEAGHAERGEPMHADPADDLDTVNQWSDPPKSQAEQATAERPPGWYWVRWNGGHAPAGPWRVVHTSHPQMDEIELEWGEMLRQPAQLHDCRCAQQPVPRSVWICKSDMFGISVHATYPCAQKRAQQPGTSVISVHTVELGEDEQIPPLAADIVVEGPRDGKPYITVALPNSRSTTPGISALSSHDASALGHALLEAAKRMKAPR